jgi:ribosomal protein S18 acetylase RimI-like enzyme
MTAITVRAADLNDADDGAALVEILDAYAAGPTGQGRPLAADVRERLVPGLRAHPKHLVLFAIIEARPVGVAVCFEGYSTFAARPLLNLHDLAVLPEYRGRGIGGALLEGVCAAARERGCCKVTLEVLARNEPARRLYAQAGFGPWEEFTYFVAKAIG